MGLSRSGWWSAGPAALVDFPLAISTAATRPHEAVRRHDATRPHEATHAD